MTGIVSSLVEWAAILGVVGLGATVLAVVMVAAVVVAAFGAAAWEWLTDVSPEAGKDAATAVVGAFAIAWMLWLSFAIGKVLVGWLGTVTG